MAYSNTLRLACRFPALLAAALTLLFAASAFAADPATKAFDIAADTAANSLKQFSEQSGVDVVFATETTANIRTNAVIGDYTPRQALDLLLSGTGLIAEQNPRTGAFSVMHDPNDRRAAPVRATGGPSKDDESPSERTVTLNPFEVQADSDKSYGALNSNSITAFNIELDKLPISADVFDQAFMRDIAESYSVEQMIQEYSPGAGYNASNASQDAGISLPGNRVSGIGLRGLASSVMLRDGFMPLSSTGTGVTAPFDVERVEVINGPQSLLYGDGGAGGVINIISKQARLGQGTFGSLTYQVDQYGHKMAQADFGVGNDTVAILYSVIDQDWGTRLLWQGGPLNGDYLQIAYKPFHNTVIRVTGEQTSFSRIINLNLSTTVTGPSTAFDARNGQYLDYLLATNQINQSATGASGMGVIDNGRLNWNNLQVLEGDWGLEESFNSWATIAAQTEWTSWLSTNIQGGFDLNSIPRLVQNYTTIDSPQLTSNPTGLWVLPDTNSRPNQNETINNRTKEMRLSALLTNDLFGGLAHSQTNIGGDFSRHQSFTVAFTYFLADSNWNPIITPAVTINNGRTVIPSIYIPITNGPIKYPFWTPFADRVTYQGQNYVRMIGNEIAPSSISPSDPLGVTTFGGANYELQTIIDKGLFAVNETDWFHGRLETLMGLRLTSDYDATLDQVAPPGNFTLDTGTYLSYNAGINFRLLSWLHPYVSFSDSYNPPTALRGNPDGNALGTSHGIGEEVGLKMANAAGTVSGSLAVYSTKSANEQFASTLTLLNDINPNGLNGRYGANPSVWTNVNRVSTGAQVILTASPNSNWRMRFAAGYTNGRIGGTSSYNQIYNDQFYENSAGDVTYADGTIVYVPAAYNSHQLTVSSTTAGAVPLTVTAMSTPGNAYYANPVAITGQISSSSPAASVLKVIDPVHGAILTGTTGLPISQIQISPGFTPPGAIPLVTKGDDTVGYSELSLNWTNLYTFPSGWMKGLKLGGTVSMNSPYRDYYYFENGIKPGLTDTLLAMPSMLQFNGIIGYERKLGRLTWSTQVNITNMFNHYSVVILPNPITGYAGPNDATFDGSPREYTWTTRINF